MKSKKHHNLDTDPISRLVISMTTPMILTGMLNTSYGFIDMIFASRLGGVQVASVAFVAPLFVMLNAITMGLSRGGTGIIAKLLGQQDKPQAAAYAMLLRQLILVLASSFAIAGFFGAPYLLKALQVSGDLFEQSLIYTQIMFFRLPAGAVIGLYMTLFMSQGKMNIASQISLLGLICNILLNSLCIFVLKMGIEGLAYATLATSVIQAAVITWLYHREQHEFQIVWRTRTKFSNWQIRGHLARVGFPLTFSNASNSFGLLLINAIIAPYGYEVVAAFAIGNQINSLMFMPSKSIGQGVVPLIAHNWGANALTRVRQAIRFSLLFALGFGIAGAIFIQVVKWPIGTFLAKGEEDILRHVINFVSLVGWTVIAWAIFHLMCSIFEAFQKTSFTFWTNAVRLWGVRIPGILIFASFFPSLEEYGVWYTMFISNVITLIFALIFFALQIPPILNPDKNKSAAQSAG